MAKKVLLLVNLGSPDSTAVKDVRRYLREFLMDERVIDIPKLARILLVKGIIAPFRAPSSAKKYKTIWSEEGSPLIVLTEKLVKALDERNDYPVYMCMRYANPTPTVVLKDIHREHPDVEEIVMLPLYPHYAMSSYETAVKHVEKAFKEGQYTADLKVIDPFYNHPMYIDALATSIKPFLEKPYDHVLFSYHGIPERHVVKTDMTEKHCMKCEDCCNVESEAHTTCYRHQIKETTELVASHLGLPKDKYSFSFQSRLGKKWLTPYTDERLKNFPKEGIKKLVIVSPAFISDCLETLEEIQVEGKEIMMEAGGEDYRTVPCLNLNKKWLETIETLVNEVE